MRTMIEGFVSVFFIALISVLLVAMVSSYILVNDARKYHADVIDRIENSDYQDEYIEEICQEARARNYELIIEDVSFNMNRRCYYVRLSFKNQMKVFSLINRIFQYEGVIEGYAI